MAIQEIDQDRLEAFVARVVLDIGTYFSQIRKLPIEDPFSVFYELKA